MHHILVCNNTFSALLKEFIILAHSSVAAPWLGPTKVCQAEPSGWLEQYVLQTTTITVFGFLFN